MVNIRKMQPEDADYIRQLEALSFLPYYQQKGFIERTPVRSRMNILASLALNPEGCFVAEDDGIIGFAFTRKWGKIGWMGTFGVHPDRQHQGIGHQLLSESINHLEDHNCKIIGLETMPDSPFNVGLYARACFQPIPPTLILEKYLVQSKHGAALTDLDSLDDVEAEKIANELCTAAVKGLSYCAEIRNAKAFGWGKTLISGAPKPWGLVVIRTEPRFEDSPNSTAEVLALVIPPKERSRLPVMIHAVEVYAHELGFKKIRIPVNATDWETLQSLLIMQYRVKNISLRMLYRGSYQPEGIDLSQWAM